MTLYTPILASYSLIFDILWRFRIGDVSLVADIKQTLLFIEIDEGTGEFLRFLWVENISENDKIGVYKFLGVIFGVTISPFLLAATVKSHVKKICRSSNCGGSFEKIIARYIQ